MAKKTSKTSGKRSLKEDRNKRTSRKPQKREPEMDFESSRTAAREVSSADNDPSWYALTPALLRDSASLPFSQALGLPFGFGESNGVLPGIAGLEVSLVPGTNDFADSPINVAARSLYSWVRHANSGSRNYDSPNLMMYILAMDSLYAAYAHCARMYGLIRVYAQKNRYYPKAFFSMIGWDYEDFIKNIAKFRLYLNTFVEKLGAMCVPANMTYTLRHMWMFQNIWLDGPTEKAQTYFFFPHEVFRYAYDSTNSQYPIQLRTIPITEPSAQTLWTVERVIAALDTAVNTLLASEDLAVMSGDILKAYGANGVWKLMPIHEDLVVLPTFSQEVMYQIHNSQVIDLPASVVGSRYSFNSATADYESCYIAEYVDTATQLTWLKTAVQYDKTAIPSAADLTILPFARHKSSSGRREGQFFLDFHHEDITPEDVMVATRLTAFPSVTATGDAAASVQWICGSETPMAWYVAYPRYNSTTKVINTELIDAQIIYQRGNPADSDTNRAPFASARYTLGALFDYFPVLWQLSLSTGAPNNKWTTVNRGNVSNIYGQIENYGGFTTDVLERMHLAAMMSEVNVPKMGAL